MRAVASSESLRSAARLLTGSEMTVGCLPNVRTSDAVSLFPETSDVAVFGLSAEKH